VRLADRRPFAVPEWMTRPEVAEAKIVTSARLPVAVIVALRNEAMTGLSSCEQIAQEEIRMSQEISGSNGNSSKKPHPSPSSISRQQCGSSFAWL